MNAVAPASDDVSSFDAVPSVGLRQYLLGARPVVGAIAASGLMLLACSWFVIEKGGFGTSRDVGGPGSVRIDGSTPAGTATARTPDAVTSADQRIDAGRGSNRGEASRAHNVRQASEHAAQGAAATGPAPAQASSKPPSASPSAPSNQTATQPPEQPAVPEIETTLPAVDQVLPPLPSPPALPVTPPALPLPDVSTTVTVEVP
jgi:hypothetical protein